MINTISTNVIFKTCCFHTRPLVYLRALRIYSHNQQIKANIEFVNNNSTITNTCNWCNKLIEEKDFDYLPGYWTPFSWHPVHKHCKKEYKDYESFECQNIDKNCNDCFFFKRGDVKSVLTKEHEFLAVDFKLNWKEQREWEDLETGKMIIKQLSLSRLAKIGDTVMFNGFCNKKQIAVHAHPNFCTGYDCFEHRKNNRIISN